MDLITQQVALAAAGSAGGDKVYVDDVFSTFLYDGNNITNQIINGIDLAGEGGLVWIKPRSVSGDNSLYDTERGAGNYLVSNATSANYDMTSFSGYGLTSFNNNGFSLGTNWTGENYANADIGSWTFRKAPGFFDVVTFTGNGTSQLINHNLGSVPGMIMVKNMESSWGWLVWHSSLSSAQYLMLDETYKAESSADAWNNTLPTSSQFSVGSLYNVNEDGKEHVAYIFANDDAQFGTNGDESIIKCGTYYGNNSATGPIIDLGFEPQWVMIKNITTGNTHTNWLIIDNMRGAAVDNNDSPLLANENYEEGNSYNPNDSNIVNFLPTGFQLKAPGYWHSNTTNNYIYMAIRRPHKPPEAGTDVFNPFTVTDGGTNYWSPGFVPDMLLRTKPNANYTSKYISSRLTGNGEYLETNTTALAAGGGNDYVHWDAPTGTIKQTFFQGTAAYLRYTFKRAPGFFDIVAYDGTGSARTQSHNLGKAPELMIVRRRNAQYSWAVYSATTGNTDTMYLNEAYTPGAYGHWNTTSPTDSVFSVSGNGTVNGTGGTYIAYLFGSVAGVSSVGSYDGSTGTNVEVNCGFIAGARFILIKRTNGTGDWYVWDSARNIIVGDDPYLLLNEDTAQVTGTDYIVPWGSGFKVASTAPAALNVTNGTYIYLAIA